MNRFCVQINKLFVSILLILLSEVLSDTQDIICKQNYGNFEVKEAFRWNNILILIGKSGQSFRIKYEWSSANDLTILSVDTVSGYEKYDLLFPIHFPERGQRLVAIHWEETHNISQMIGISFDVNTNGEIVSKSKEPLEVNYYMCPNKTVLQICSVFASFPVDGLRQQLTSMSSLPWFGFIGKDLKHRLFVYYKEVKTSQCNEVKVCYKSKRFLFIGRNKSIDGNINLIETFWSLDNTTDEEKCPDLKGRIVNASTSLTNYTSNGIYQSFYWIEFFGTHFKIIRFNVNSNDGMISSEDIKSGLIGELFKCKQKESPTPIKTTETTTNPTTPKTTTLLTVNKVSTYDQDMSTISKKKITTTPTTIKSTTNSVSTDRHTISEISTENRVTYSKEDSKTPSKTSEKPNESKSSSGVLPIILVVFVIIVVIGVVALLIWFFIRRGNTKSGTNSVVPTRSKSLEKKSSTESLSKKSSDTTLQKINSDSNAVKSDEN